jgi:hypothetical protein
MELELELMQGFLRMIPPFLSPVRGSLLLMQEKVFLLILFLMDVLCNFAFRLVEEGFNVARCLFLQKKKERKEGIGKVFVLAIAVCCREKLFRVFFWLLMGLVLV